MIKMVVGIQLFGILFGITMIYLAFIYLKKKDLTINDFIIWLIVWLIFILAVMFPLKLNVLMDTLGIIGAMQFFAVAGIIFLFAIVFYLYTKVRKNQKQLAKIVKEIALNEVKK